MNGMSDPSFMVALWPTAQVKGIADSVELPDSDHNESLQLKFPFALWTRAMIRTLIWRKYRVNMSLASVGRLLAQLGLSCQRPLAKASEQNPSLTEQWVKKEYQRIRAWAKQEGGRDIVC